MLIEDMFERPIDRYIDGVIKPGNERNIIQEFDEYVVTDELLKYFDLFFEKFSNQIINPTGEIGVWISGFYGSGKSHFLKMLSYILDNKYENNGKKPIDFFIDDRKITDKKIISNMQNSINDNDVILFNISSKSLNQSSVKDVFINQFNELCGFSSKFPMIADFERKLVKENKFNDFIDEFEKINGDSWFKMRDDLFFCSDDFIKSNVNIDFMSKKESEFWLDNFSNDSNKSIENFAFDVNEYCENNSRKVIFAVDEVGQYIAENVNLMLELQTIVEELSVKCNGKAWVIVTSQQQITELIKNKKSHDFSKIQGRFKTRLNLSSSHIDEIIKLRILNKKSDIKDILSNDYNNFDSSLKNIIDFEKSSDKKIYDNVKDYVDCYPFIPYQFELIQNSLINIRLNQQYDGAYFSEGERSLIGIYQETLVNFSNKNNGKLIPIYEFYNPVSIYCSHSLIRSINLAENNKKLNDFDILVLKSLFLIKYLDDDYLYPSLNNITTLMISNVNEDKLNLKEKIRISLNKLIEQVYVHKNGELYYYLTEKEQDINLEIQKQTVEQNEIYDELSDHLSEIYAKKKYKIQSRYSYSVDQIIDEEVSNSNLGIRFITSFYSFENDDGNLNKNIKLKHLSELNNEVIVYLDENRELSEDIISRIKIQKFLSKKILKNKNIECEKMKESDEIFKRIKNQIINSIINSTIYITGNKYEFKSKNHVSILDDALQKLFENVYPNWKYMDFNPTKEDIHNALSIDYQQVLEPIEIPSINALNALDDYLSTQINPKSLKDIIMHFSNVPYGYVEDDISWIVATSFAQKRISLILNDSELFLNSENTQEIFDYITSGKNSLTSKKLLLSIKISIPSKRIKSVKDVYKDLSNDNTNYSDEELMAKFREIISLNQGKISNYIRDIRRSDKYPGLEMLEKYNSLSNELLSKNTLSSFYDYVFVKEDDFLDYIDDLKVIFEFYEGNQIDIFDKSCFIYDEFKQNEMLLNSSKLSEIVNEINNIISLKNPYSKIKDLSKLNNEYCSIFNSILKNKYEKLLDSINDDYNFLLSELDDEQIRQVFIDDIEHKFNRLKRDLDRDRNLYSINGKMNESNNIKIGFLDEINAFKEKNNSLSSQISIDLTDLFEDEINIANEKEMELFLENIKNELQKELKNNKTVKIINTK